MDSLFTELRKAREARGMSLAEVADATLINIRFLEDIERGEFTFLPRTYVRAFVREYAEAVGLDPAPVLSALEGAAETPSPAPITQQPPQATAAPPAAGETSRRQIDPSTARIAIIIIVIVVVAIALWNILGSREPVAVNETPFDTVRTEQERRAAQDTTAVVTPQVAPVRDSLVLTAVVADSARMQIVIDDSAMRTLSLRPGRKATWKAARRFVLSLDNAGAVDFTLNKKSLGKLGKTGTAVRNVELTHAILSRK